MNLFVLSYLNSASPSVVSTHWSLMILVKLSNVRAATSLQRTHKNWTFLKCGWKKVFKCSLNLSWHLFLTRMFLVTKGKTRPLWQFTVHGFFVFCFVVLFCFFFPFLYVKTFCFTKNLRSWTFDKRTNLPLFGFITCICGDVSLRPFADENKAAKLWRLS